LTVNTSAGTGGVDLSGANYRWEIGALTDAGSTGTGGAGSAFDQLLLSGGAGSTTVLTLSGSSMLTVAFNAVADPNSGNTFWNADHVWKVIDVAGTTTTLGTLAISNGSGWANNRGFTSYIGNGITGDTGDVYVQFSQVPEPGSLSLLALAGAGALMRRRFRRNGTASTR
jgi:hypothetical protein